MHYLQHSQDTSYQSRINSLGHNAAEAQRILEEEVIFIEQQKLAYMLVDIMTTCECEEVKYLGELKNPLMYHLRPNKELPEGHYFDLKDRDHPDYAFQGIPASKADFQNKILSSGYLTRVQDYYEPEKKSLPALSFCHNALRAINLINAQRRGWQEGLEHLRYQPVQNVSQILSHIMTPEHYFIWLSHKEQKELGQQVPVSQSIDLIKPPLKI